VLKVGLLIVALFVMIVVSGSTNAYAEIIFKTKKLDQDFYRFCIMGQILGQGYDPNMIKKWKITVYDLSQTKPEFYEHVEILDGQKINPNMPSGVTGKMTVDLYLLDSEGLMQKRMNSHIIQHEMAHAMLYDKYGGMSNLWVDLVHNNNATYTLQLTKDESDWKFFSMKIIDIRSWLKTTLQLA